MAASAFESYQRAWRQPREKPVSPAIIMAFVKWRQLGWRSENGAADGGGRRIAA